MNDNSKETKKLIAELRGLRGLKHKKILGLIGTYRGPVGDNYTHRFFVVTEFMENGNLKELLQKQDLDSGVLLGICTDITKGMCHLSKNGFIHRNLRARNILIAKNFEAKISGFEKCAALRQDSTIFVDNQQPLVLRNNQSYNVKWMAPESIKSSVYSSKSDVWSFGVTMYETWTKGSEPWTEKNDQEAEDLIIKGASLELPSSCSHKLRICVNSMMEHETSKRLSFFQILVILNEIKREKSSEMAEDWSEIGVYDHK
jgi:serine/threonine protein kinase